MNDYDAIARTIEQARLQIEDHFRVVDDGFFITSDGLEAAQLGVKYEGPFFACDSLDGRGISRCSYAHPLSEFYNNGDPKNGWAAATLLVNVALNWYGSGDQSRALEIVAELIANVDPMADSSLMLFRARYDDRALLNLASVLSKSWESR